MSDETYYVCNSFFFVHQLFLLEIECAYLSCNIIMYVAKH